MTAPNPAWTPLLLADPSPCLRRLVLVELLSQAQPARPENRRPPLRYRGCAKPPFRISRSLPPTTKPAKASNPPRMFVMRRPTGRLRTLDCMAQPGQAGAAAGMNDCPENRPPSAGRLAGFISEIDELTGAMETDRLAIGLLARQQADGSWQGANLDMQSDPLRATTQALLRLGYLGFAKEHPAVQRGAEYIFSAQQLDGSWPLPGADDEEEGERYSMIPLQTALPLRALAACGLATDPRAERGFEWLLAQRLPDGAWPTGIAAGVHGYVAGYRRLAHSRWGCRSNTTGALICLALHPTRRSDPAARRSLDLLLGRETREVHAVGFEVARIIGAEPTRGFLTYYARFDSALLLDLCWRIGASAADDRVADLAGFVGKLQGAYGLWEYASRPQASRWVSFDILRSLSRLGGPAAWISLEPRTPFRPYPRQTRR